MFKEPLVSSDEMQLTDPDAITTLIARLDAAGKDDNSVMGVLQAIAAEWMRKTYAKVLTPMAPRNAQILMFLLCAEWAQMRLSSSTPQQQRTLVGRVGTGEGKSLIIAMNAVYLVKVLKRRVHVLESNKGLMDRDYADFEAFYAKLGVSSACNDFSASADVTYCLTRELDHYYRDHVGKKPFGNTVLVVDEVDALIVDGDANSTYVKPDASATGNLKAIFDALERGGGDAPAHRGDPLYDEARGAYHQAQARLRRGQNQPGGYAIFGNAYKLVDEKGRPSEIMYSLDLEFLSYIKLGKEPSLMNVFFYQSTAHMLRQYDAIIGLSGSLGSPAEKAFLAATYGASTIEAPPFLDTCRGVRKVPPVLLDDAVQVYGGTSAHLAAVKALALKHRSRVPVVVLCKNPQAARTTLQCFPQADREPQRSVVQLFLEFDEAGQRMNYSSIVERATLPVGKGSSRLWPVTVTDVFGGRGQDYRVADSTVDDAGGLLVIAACFPDTEREWTQWRGRTARNDRAGQYAVLLERSDEPVSDDAALLTRHAVDTPPGVQHKRSLLDELLARRDGQCQDKVNREKEALLKGMRMNELCDKFWTREGGVGGVWPSGSAQVKLRDFLNKYDFSFDAIARFAAEVGLARSAADYKAASAYAA